MQYPIIDYLFEIVLSQGRVASQERQLTDERVEREAVCGSNTDLENEIERYQKEVSRLQRSIKEKDEELGKYAFINLFS